MRLGTRIGLFLVALAAITAAACGPKKAPPVAAPAAPAFPSFEFPDLVEPLPTPVPAAVRTRYEQGWATLQAGKADDAAAIFADVVRATPAFYPAKAAQALLALVEAPNPPARLFLGDDALGLVEQKLDAMKGEITAWEVLSRSTNFTS